MNINNQKLFFSICFVLHSIQTVNLGLIRSWGGDEWFSYRDFTIMGLPFSILGEIQKFIIGPVSKDNFIFYKIQSLLWIGILFYFLYYFYSISNNQKERNYIKYISLFLVFSPFIIGQSQVFRYYNLYLLSSFVIYFIISDTATDYAERRKLYLITLIISPFIHFFSFVQIGIFILFNELLSIKKHRNYFIISAIILLIAMLSFDSLIITTWNTYFIQYSIPENFNNRGLSIGSLIKPFNAIFVFLFGRETSPFQFFIIDLVFILVGIVLLFIFIKMIMKKDLRLNNLLVAGVIPYLFIFFILEPMTLPGMTQAEPQHVLFFLPWLIFLFHQILDYHYGKIMLYIISGSILYSNYLQTSKIYPDWKNVEQMIESNNTVITDVPGNVEFHLATDSIIWFMDQGKVNRALDNQDTLIIITENYANYQILRLDQKWNSAKGTFNEVKMLNYLYDELQKRNFILIKAYSKFPLHSMLFVRNDSLISSKPILLDIKYQDISLPLLINDKKVIGFEKLNNESYSIFNDSLFYFIQIDENSKYDYLTKIIFKDGSDSILHLNSEDDSYRKYYCRSFLNDQSVYSYKKNPLVSNSLKHHGSIFQSDGRIFLHTSKKEIKRILFPNNNLFMYKAILSGID